MEHEAERNAGSDGDALQAAITTAEHRSLGDVLEVIQRLEALRSRGLSPTQIAERIRLTHPTRPGGGPWSAEAVERVLEIADASRRHLSTGPSDPPITQPVAVHTTPPPPGPRPGIARPNRPRTDPAAGTAGAAYPPGTRPAVPVERPAGANKQPAPLRVEPRRQHRRPPFDAEVASPADGGRRWPVVVGFLVLAGLAAVAFGLYRDGTFEGLATGDESQATTTTTSATAQAVAAPEADADPADATGESTSSGGSADDGSNAPASPGEGGADQLVVRIEPSAPETDDGVAPASATIRTDGKLYIEGAFRSESEARSFLDAAAEVFGTEALVSDYTIDPTAPDPTVSDVILEKPVLFESGSAVIDPEYIPFLEACGDVLKLNPHIVMSVSAFTDASGDSEFNLELSQQRADAVINFYRTLDIGDDQLISTGFGESDFVADNETEEGRQRNRRAILELLNIMKDPD